MLPIVLAFTLLQTRDFRTADRPQTNGVVFEGNVLEGSTVTVTQSAGAIDAGSVYFGANALIRALDVGGIQVDRGSTCEVRCSKEGTPVRYTARSDREVNEAWARREMLSSLSAQDEAYEAMDRKLKAREAEVARLKANWPTAVVTDYIAALCLSIVALGLLLTRLDKIVGAWRRSELPKLPWLTFLRLACVLGLPFVGLTAVAGLLRLGEVFARVTAPPELYWLTVLGALTGAVAGFWLAVETLAPNAKP